MKICQQSTVVILSHFRIPGNGNCTAQKRDKAESGSIEPPHSRRRIGLPGSQTNVIATKYPHEQRGQDARTGDSRRLVVAQGNDQSASYT